MDGSCASVVVGRWPVEPGVPTCTHARGGQLAGRARSISPRQDSTLAARRPLGARVERPLGPRDVCVDSECTDITCRSSRDLYGCSKNAFFNEIKIKKISFYCIIYHYCIHRTSLIVSGIKRNER